MHQVIPVAVRLVLMGVGTVLGLNVGGFIGAFLGIGVDQLIVHSANGEPVYWGISLGAIAGAVAIPVGIALLLRRP